MPQERLESHTVQQLNDLHERRMKYLQMLADKGVDGVLICMARENDSEKWRKWWL